MTHGPWIEPGGSRLEQHATRVAHQLPARPQHEAGDDERRKAVRLLEAEKQHRDPRDDGGNGPEEVGQDMRHRPLDVERPPLASRERPCGADVRQPADHADDDDDFRLDVGRRGKPAHGLHGDDRGEDQQGRAIDLGSEDLGPSQPERVAARCRLGGQPHRDERKRDGRRISQHVRRIRQQRER